MEDSSSVPITLMTAAWVMATPRELKAFVTIHKWIIDPLLSGAFSFRRSLTMKTMVFSFTVFRYHQYPDMRLTAQDHIWTLNDGGVLTATWTSHGGNQIPAYFVLKGDSIKLTGDPGATGGKPVVCCRLPLAPSVILVSSPPLAMSPCPFLMAMMICKAPCPISFWWPPLPLSHVAMLCACSCFCDCVASIPFFCFDPSMPGMVVVLCVCVTSVAYSYIL